MALYASLYLLPHIAHAQVMQAMRLWINIEIMCLIGLSLGFIGIAAWYAHCAGSAILSISQLRSMHDHNMAYQQDPGREHM